MRELRCQERMPELGSPSAASIPASGRRGVGTGLSAGAPALVRGEEKLGGRCSRREENHASRKGHSCRLIFFATQLFIPQISPLSQSLTAFCTAQPNLNLSPIKAIHAELGQNAPAVMLHQLHDVVARICVFSVFIYYCAHILFI